MMEEEIKCKTPEKGRGGGVNHTYRQTCIRTYRHTDRLTDR